MKNIIRKHIIDIQYNGDIDGFVLQKEIDDWCKETLIKTLDEQLERISHSGKVIKIDSLEIDVKIDEGSDWLEKLSNKVVQQLNDRIITEMEKERWQSEIKDKSGNESLFDSFIYFLQKGSLPWWSSAKEQKVFFEELDTLIESGMNQQMKATLAEVAKYPDVKQRMIWQLPDKLFFELIDEIAPATKKLADNLAADIKKIEAGSTDTEKRKLNISFKQALFDHVYEADDRKQRECVVASFVQYAAASKLSRMLNNAEKEINLSALKEKIREMDMTGPGAVSLMNADALRGNNDKEIKKAYTVLSEEEGEGIYIDNAGLIIVAGFLPAIFKKLELVSDDKITDINKAVCLVHYLAAAKENVAEFELGLAKILCGLEMETPVDTDIGFSDSEKNEANELLLSVIEYWSILKTTSVEGLRQSFLLRSGKLSFTNDEWLLQVEQKPYDMLLKSLSWNITMIRLPWMKKILKIEWIF